MTTTELLKQTEEHVQEVKKRVSWVGNRDGTLALSWEKFKKLAPVEYDDGYGGREIASDLVVVFTDGSWLERWEYDGSEGWVHKTLPVKNKKVVAFTKVKIEDWEESLETINKVGVTR